MSEARAPAEQRGDAFRRFMLRPEAPALVFLAVLLVAFSLSSDKFLSGKATTRTARNTRAGASGRTIHLRSTAPIVPPSAVVGACTSLISGCLLS